jgi:hypothetical protein
MNHIYPPQEYGDVRVVNCLEILLWFVSRICPLSLNAEAFFFNRPAGKSTGTFSRDVAVLAHNT